MKVEILYITYNRIESTKLTLPKLLQSPGYPFSLTIVDNGSTDTTVTYLKEIISSYRLKYPITLLLNDRNEGLSRPTNIFWQSSDAELVGKIDNDILVADGWLQKLVKAHEKIDNLAIIGGIHFPKELINYKKFKHNIYQYNAIQILRQPYIGGNYIAKKDILLENGFLNEGAGKDTFKLGGWTGYQETISNKGYVLGYYYPLIFFKHIKTFPDSYYRSVRGVSRRKYVRWEKRDGEKLLNTKWDWQR